MKSGLKNRIQMARVALGLACLGLFCSCASIFGGTQKDVWVCSTPSGALVRLDGVTRGLTPTVLHPSTRSDHAISLELPGYESVNLSLQRKMSAWEWANVLNGGAPGVLYDFATGAICRFAPARVDVRLLPQVKKKGGIPGASRSRGQRGGVDSPDPCP